MAAPSQASVRVIKRMTYRGVTRDWGNRYFTNQSTIPDSSHFNTLADAIVLAEKATQDSHVSIVEVKGYNGGSEIQAFSKTYATVGTLVMTGNVCPGDAAILARWATAYRSTKNHPIYLYNYFHGVWNQTAFGSNDLPVAAQSTAFGTYCNSRLTGFSDGTTTYKRAGPSGHLATGVTIE